MRKWIICFLIFIVVVFGGIGAYLLTFDINAYHADVERKLTQLVGQPVKIGGSLFMEKSLEPTLILQDVSVQDPLDENKSVVKAKEVLIQFDLLSYLKNVYAVSTMLVTGAEVNLTKDKAGQNNWSFIFRPSERRNIDETHLFSLEHFKVNSLDATYADAQEEKEYKVNFSRMALEQMVNLEGNFVYENEKGTLKGSFMNLQEALSGSGKLEFVLDISAYHMQTTYSCMIPDLSRINERTLNLHIVGENLNQCVSAFYEGLTLPEINFDFQSAVKVTEEKSFSEGSFSVADKRVSLSFSNLVHDYARDIWAGRVHVEGVNENFLEQYGLKPFGLNGVFQKNADKMAFQFNGTANESDLEGTLALSLNTPKKQLSGQLKSRYFSLKDIVADSTRRAFTSKNFDVDLMNKIEANLYILVENLDVRDVLKSFPQLYTHVILKDGQLNVDILEGTTLASGSVVGKLDVHVAGKRLNGSTHLVGERLRIEQIQMFKDFLKGGMINTECDGTFSGRSLKDWLPSYSGKVAFSVSDTVILGLGPTLNDLGIAPVNNLGKSISMNYNNLVVKNGYADLKLKNGETVLKDNVVFATNRFDASVEGEVSLKDNTFSLDVFLFPWKEGERFENSIFLTGDMSDWDLLRYSKKIVNGERSNKYDEISRKVQISTVNGFLGRAEEKTEETVIPGLVETYRVKSFKGGMVPANGNDGQETSPKEE